MSCSRLASISAAIVLATSALTGPLCTVADAQSGLVVGSGNFFSPIVGNLDKAIAFYRDAIGLDITGTPANAEQNAPIRNMLASRTRRCDGPSRARRRAPDA